MNTFLNIFLLLSAECLQVLFANEAENKPKYPFRNRNSFDKGGLLFFL